MLIPELTRILKITGLHCGLNYDILIFGRVLNREKEHFGNYHSNNPAAELTEEENTGKLNLESVKISMLTLHMKSLKLAPGGKFSVEESREFTNRLLRLEELFSSPLPTPLCTV